MRTTGMWSAMLPMRSWISRRAAPILRGTIFRISSDGRRARCFLRTTPSSALPDESGVRCGLFDGDDHGVRADEVFDAGFGEAGFFHPADAVGSGVVEAAW